MNPCLLLLQAQHCVQLLSTLGQHANTKPATRRCFFLSWGRTFSGSSGLTRPANRESACFVTEVLWQVSEKHFAFLLAPTRHSCQPRSIIASRLPLSGHEAGGALLARWGVGLPREEMHSSASMKVERYLGTATPCTAMPHGSQPPNGSPRLRRFSAIASRHGRERGSEPSPSGLVRQICESNSPFFGPELPD